jgi:hypothetical protein
MGTNSNSSVSGEPASRVIWANNQVLVIQPYNAVDFKSS